MGTEKRERQKTGRLARAEVELAAARRARRRRTVVRAVIGVAAVVALLFGWSALQGDDGEDETETADETPESTTTTAPEYANPELAQEVMDREPPDPAPPPEDTAADALEVSTVTEGEGEGAAAGDQITVHYVGKIPDGTVFDSSWERGQPIPVALGQGQVIPGWDEGMVGAKIGERRRLVIGSEKAYGAEGAPDGGIPPNSPLAFEVDVVDIQPGAAAANAPAPAPGG